MFTREQLEGILVAIARPQIAIAQNVRHSTGYKIKLSVEIRAMNREFLVLLQESLKECGIDSYLKEIEKKSRPYPVLRITNADTLINLFQIIPNLPKHCVNFDSFLEAVTLFSNKHHLTQKGLNRMLEIKGLL